CMVAGSSSLLGQRASAPACDPDNGGLTLAPGFCAKVVATDLGAARNLVIAPNGDAYVTIQRGVREPGQPPQPGFLMALRDTNGDGTFDQREKFGTNGATGIVLRNGYLYFATTTSVERFKLTSGQLVPSGPAEVMVGGFPEQRGHQDKDVAFDDKGNMFVTIGLPSNACAQPDRQPGAKGVDPCPQLENGGGVWKFSDTPGQTYSAKNRYATGLRQGLALTWHAGRLYLAMNSRDSLDTLYPDLFTPDENQNRPLEPLVEIKEGSTFGWPYCFLDGKTNKMILAPEYGGNGTEIGRCAQFDAPIAGYPAHSAPVDLQFFSHPNLPAKYRDGAFIVMHGSWNRAPAPMQGYNILYQPFAGGKPSGKYEVFADGFAGKTPLMSPTDAVSRANGIAIGPDGSLYITESVKGKTWRVFARAK
ncbi:MAG: sorbosone dehydrogenase, partial [Acidobacteria bacterium]|nr:sorbosone dehydrogenase [Acidobacteriota bacterium]